MARLKFVVFALVVLGAWAAHLYLLSPEVSARAVEQAEARAAAAPAAVSVGVQQRKIDLQRTALNIAADPEALALLHPARPGKSEAPTAQTLAAFRSALGEAVPASLEKALVLALVNDEGAVASRGAEPLPEKDFEAEGLAHAGADGLSREAFGQSHLFYSVPVYSVPVTGSEGRVVAHVVVGAPLIAPELIESVAGQAGLGAVGLLEDGKVVQAAGAQKALVQAAAAKIGSGKSQILERGSVAALGPLHFPVLTGTGPMGGDAPLFVSSRQALSSTPFEVVAIASVAPFMTALADYQRLAVFGFGGILLLSLVFLLVMGNGKAQAPAPEKDEGVSPADAAGASSAGAETQQAQSLAGEPAPIEPAPQPAAPSAETAAPSAEAAAPPLPPSPATPFDDALFAPPPPAPPPAFAAGEGDATMAYPTGADPFVLAAQQQQALEGEQDFNPEATRVASVPAELLRASARPPSEPEIRAVSPEEAHYQEVFREFLKTREQCGEPPDGLTYEKFAQKLRKNREQLVAKYHCRTVRFQVHVKEGRAALKATPIKD